MTRERVTTSELVNKISERSDAARELMQQLPIVTEQTIQALQQRSREIGMQLLEESRKPFELGMAIADFGTNQNRPDLFNFGFALVDHIQNGGKVEDFMGQHKEFEQLDLNSFLESQEEWAQVASSETPNVSLRGILTTNILIGDVSTLEQTVVEPRKKKTKSVKERSVGKKEKKKKEKIKKEKVKKEKRSISSTTTFDDVASLYPAIGMLFSDEGDDYWTKIDGTKHISRSELVTMFEQKQESAVPDRDKYQAVVNLCKLYVKHAELDLESFLVKAEEGGRDLYISMNDLSAFLVFAADRLTDSERPNLKLTSSNDLEFGKKKLD